MLPATVDLPPVKWVFLAAFFAAFLVSASDMVVGEPISALVTFPFSSTLILTVTFPSTSLL